MAKTVIYQHSGAYAQEHDELKKYFASFNALRDCKEAIEQAIANHYHDNRLNDGGAREVIAQFGLERTMYVLAATVQAKDSDGRIDQDNKAWARAFPLVVDMDAYGRDRTMDLQLYRAHPGLIDLFVHEARDEAAISCPVYRGTFDQAKEAGELSEYRTSVRVNKLCQREIEQAVDSGWDGWHVAPDAVKGVLERFGPERLSYVLANTVQQKDWDERFSGANVSWAKTVPMFVPPEKRTSCIVNSHPAKLDDFIIVARKEMMRIPLTREDIKAEAGRILADLRAAPEPNSPNGTHFMAQVSPDFLARASSKDHDRLMGMLPFSTLSLSKLEGHKGTFALISQNEDRNKPLRLRKPSVRKKLQKQPDAPAAPSAPGKSKSKGQER